MMILEKKPTKKQPIGLPKANLKSKFLRSPQLLWSGSAGIIAYDCISSSIGSVNSPGSSGAISLAGVQGLGMRFGTIAGGDSNGALIWTGRPTANPTKYTLAAHFVTSTSNSAQILLSSSGDNSGFRLTVNSTGTSLLFTKGGIVDVTTISISTGIEYFVIVSHDETTDEYYVILKNLQNNSVSITTGTDTATANAGNGKFEIGNFTDFAPRSFNGLIYSAYIGFDFLPLSLGMEWSNDSWNHFDTAYTFEKLHTNKTHYYVKQDFTKQPIGAAAKKLIQNKYHLNPQLAWIGSSVTAYDSFIGQLGVVSGGFTQVVGPGGIGLTFGNATSAGLSFPGKDNVLKPRYTYAGHFRPKASSTYQVLVANSSSGSNGVMLQIDSSGTSFNFVKPGVESVNSLSMTTDRDYFGILSHDEGTDTYWMILKDLQSGAVTSVSGTTTSSVPAVDGTFVIGNIIGSNRSFNGYIYSAYIAYEFLPFSVGLELANNSWKLFGSSTIYTIRDGDDPVVAISYDLTIDPSTYALTNTNISFFSDRFINLIANNYSLTNNNISLSLGKFISLDSNAYLLANSNITLLTDKLLSVDANSYALTNNDANLLYSRNFSLDPNTYSLTNSNISLLLGKLLSVDPNTYSLTNSNISFYSDRSLSITPATYTLTNSNINLYSGKLLDLSPNSYTLTNSNTSLLYGRTFSLDPNSYTLTLSDISYNLGKFFSIDPATYTLTTQDVSYYYNRVLSTSVSSLDLIFNNIAFSTSGGFVIDPATFDITNSNIGLSIERLLSSDPNTYTLINNNISFIADRKVNIDANAYIISNQPVSLLVDKKLSVDSTNYALTNSNISFTRNYTINIGAASLALLFNDISFLSSYVFPAPSSVRYGVLYGPDGDYKTGTFLGFNTVDIASGRTVRKTTLRTSVLE